MLDEAAVLQRVFHVLVIYVISQGLYQCRNGAVASAV